MVKRFILGLGLVLIMVGCSGNAAAYQWLKAPGWSRAVRIGMTSAGDPTPLTLDEQGNSYLFLIGGDEEPQPQVVAYNTQMELRWDVTLAIGLVLPDKPKLFWQKGGLDLYWLSNRTLYFARLNPSGETLVAPTAISPGTVEIETYSLVHDQEGTAHIWFSSARREPGLYAMTMTVERVVSAAAVVDPLGIHPVIIMDNNQTLHAVWVNQVDGGGAFEIYYADYPEGQYQPEQQTLVVSFNVSATSFIQGPEFGLTTDLAYLFWTIEVRTGPSAGAMDTRYATFVPGQPETISSNMNLNVPVSSNLNYQAWDESTFLVGQRVNPTTDEYPTSGTFNDIATNKSVADELPIAFHNATVQYESRQTNGQSALLYLDNGVPTSYQLLSYSSRASRTPYLLSDETDHLYITWLEANPTAGFDVYFATTAPEIVTALDRLVAADYLQMAGSTLFGMVSGMVLSPLVIFIWLIGPMAIVGGTLFFQRGLHDDQLTWGSLIIIVLSVGVYWAGKMVALPNIFEYVPFSVWVPIIPVWLEGIMRWGVPLLISVGGLVGAWHFTIRRHVASPLYFMLIFGLVDGLLTLAIYGFYFYNFF